MTDEFENLMQRAGRRLVPPADVRDPVYAAAHAAWRRRVRKRMRRRQLAVATSLLGAALLGSLVWLGRQPPAAAPRLATVESITGNVVLREDSGAAAAAPLQRARSIHKGELIQTAPGSKLTLRRPGGILIHVGGHTELQWQTDDALRVTRGIVYVDTNPGVRGADALQILTHASRIRHIGTRFSVQVEALDVRVLVREGAVAIGNGRGEQRVASGRAARIAAGGELSEVELTPGEGPWQWLGNERPQFALEGRRLDDVLQDLALASGLPLSYGSPQIEAGARELVLHGPPLGLEARDAIDTVLLTTRFTRRAPLEIVPRP